MTSRIDLRSDTQTQPSPGMRDAMANAPVGDEQIGEDPTTNRLLERVCEMLGKEAAIFLPSATMANQIAFAVLAEGGDELIGHRLSHPFLYEAGAPAYLARIMMQPLDGMRGMFTASAVEEVIRPADNHHFSRSRILLVENTTNRGGGGVWPLDQLKSVCAVAERAGMKCHLDGARLLNASVASGVLAAHIAAHFDTVTLCFSKGLGAPVGACLAGSKDIIEEAWRFKHMFGGAMRQSGVIAAAALYALEFNVERLAEDHANARLLAEGIASLPGIILDVQHVETNIVIFDVSPSVGTAAALASSMAEKGVHFMAMTPQTCRLVTHLDVSRQQIDQAIQCFREVLSPDRSALS